MSRSAIRILLVRLTEFKSRLFHYLSIPDIYVRVSTWCKVHESAYRFKAKEGSINDAVVVRIILYGCITMRPTYF